MNLSIKQTEALDLLEDKTTTQVIYGGGAGGGKSFLGCYWLLKMCYKYPGTKWVLGRKELKKLKQTTLVTFFNVCKMMGVVAEKHYNYNITSGEITFNNGSVILLIDLAYKPSDPDYDSLGSLEITGAYIDEIAEINEKGGNILKSRIRYKLDENNLIPKMFGTLNPSINGVYKRFYLPYSKGEENENQRFVRATVDDNPYISKFYKQNLLELDDISKQRLLYGNWGYLENMGELVTIQSIDNLFNSNVVDDYENRYYISADIARLGEDKTVIMVGRNLEVIHTHIMTREITTVVAQKINELAIEYSVPKSRIVVDADGVGGGVADILGAGIVQFTNGASPLDFSQKVKGLDGEVKIKVLGFANLKSQCAWRLASEINNGTIAIKNMNMDLENDLREELQMGLRRANYENEDKNKLLDKKTLREDISRSPDLLDTMIMRMYFELHKKQFTKSGLSADRMTISDIKELQRNTRGLGRAMNRGSSFSA